jgi:hypothetical protein
MMINDLRAVDRKGRRHSLDCYFKATLKKIVNLGSNLRLTFWEIAALSISGGVGKPSGFIAIAAQVHTYHLASVWPDPG